MQMDHQVLDGVQAVAILVKEGGIGAFRDSSSVKDVNWRKNTILAVCFMYVKHIFV